MFTISAKIRKKLKRGLGSLREKGKIPAVLYGRKVKNIPLEIDYKDFEKVFREAGESSLISLKIEGEKKIYQVLVHDVQRDSLKGRFIHVDFYHPSLTEKTEAVIPLNFIGKSDAVKNLGGTLVKNILEVEVKALPQDLPHEIEVDISKIKTFDDHVKIADLKIPSKVEILREADEIVASVVAPEKEEVRIPQESEAKEIKEAKEETAEESQKKTTQESGKKEKTK